MEGTRRQRGDYYRRSHNKKPPRATWRPTVPSWEKDFCKAVGTLDWETVLQMKKFMHLYSEVLNWDDSAGEEAFHNAKKRYWAEINSLSYDTPLPNPDLYIDQVNWDSEIETEMLLDVENKPVTPDAGEEHDPVVIFGDSLMPNQAFSPSGWGDDEENAEVPVNHISPNFGDPREPNWRNSINNVAATSWTGYCVNTWQYKYGSDPAQYVSRDSNCNNWNGRYADNTYHHQGPDIKDKIFDRKQRLWSESNCATANAGGYVWAPRDQGGDHYRNHGVAQDTIRHHIGDSNIWCEQWSRAKKRNPGTSCGPVGHHTAMTVARAWNQEKPFS